VTTETRTIVVEAEQEPIAKGARVVAKRDLHAGVKAGDQGRVMMVNGIDWFRYWVDFGDGRQLHWLDADDVQPATKRRFRR
jgi:hypothetical protein